MAEVAHREDLKADVLQWLEQDKQLDFKQVQGDFLRTGI